MRDRKASEQFLRNGHERQGEMKVYQDNLITGKIEFSENTRLWNVYIKKIW